MTEQFIQAAKDGDNDFDELTAIPIFVNISPESQKNIYEVANAFLLMDKARERDNKEQYEIFRTKFEELRETHYNHLSPETLAVHIGRYFQFTRRFYNRGFKTEAEKLSELTGIINRITLEKSGVKVPFINPIKASAKPEMNLRDRMRRRHRGGAQNHPDTLAVMLQNSFVYTRIKRPTRLALINLINEVELKLRYFGARWAINSINLERAGIARIIVDFFIEHITYHTVEDVLDKEELKSVLLANDIEGICMALLQASSPNGVYYQMTCMANKCRHSEVKLYDPYDLYVVMDEELDEDQRDFTHALVNYGKKFPIEEIRKYQNRYKFKGEPVDVKQQLYSHYGAEGEQKAYGEFNLAVPTMADYFTTFDHIAETFDTTLQKYSIDYPDVDKYRKKRSEFLGATRMADHVQWIKNYITYGDPNTDEPDDVIDDRSESHREFEQGLLDIFSDDDIAFADTMMKITSTVPFMTHTLVGFTSSQCSACKGVGGEDPNLPAHTLTKSSGFTPIDPVLNFFDHTRMLINELGELATLHEEAIT